MIIFVGVPTRGVVFTKTVKGILDSFRKEEHELYFETINPVSDARNNIVKKFLSGYCSHLLMIDDDEVLTPEILSKIKKKTNEGFDIVVVDAPAKKTSKSNIFKNKDGSIVASGFGCALFSRKVFETIPDPWFDLSPRRRMEYNGEYSFPIIDDAPPNEWGGEDVNFSLKLKEYGFEIYQAEGVCEHLEYEPFNNDKRATKILEIKTYDQIKPM